MNKLHADLENVLKSIKQEQLLAGWEDLSELEKQSLAEQISTLNLTSIKAERESLAERRKQEPVQIEPLEDVANSAGRPHAALGRELLEAGKAGCLIVAGGQGTRLGFPGPKGKFPISNVTGKSLFQIFAERTVAASRQFGQKLPLAIMTSPQNHEETVAFFEEHDFFGLDPEQIDFFTQTTLPFLDDNGNLFLETPSKIAMGPDGNGSSLHAFHTSGVYAKWKARGVETVNFILVDNVLADPYDAELIGFHAQHRNDITVKCVQRLSPEEKVGLLVKTDAGIRVVEYSEMPSDIDQSLHRYANISLFCFDMAFIERAQALTMPLHAAYKEAESISGKVWAWKFEYFIFDVFRHADKIGALLYPREECFAPLKNPSGRDSADTVRQALQSYEQKLYTEVTGQEPPSAPFELDADFYYRG